MEQYLYLILIAAVIGFLVYSIVSRNKRQRDRFLRQIISSWGNLPKREYDYGELENIAKYYEKTKSEDEFSLDDITWNDLDLDSVYIMMNNCRSCVGDDYLYKLLRTPLMSKRELEERVQTIRFFAEHPKVRQDYQLGLSNVGRSKKFSLIEYVNTLGSLVPESNLGHILQDLMYLVVIFLVIMNPAMGILAAIVVLIYNVYTYYKAKGAIEPYFVTVGAVVRLVTCAQDVIKLNAPELAKETEEMKQAVKALASVKKDSKFLGSTDRFSGDMGSIMADYLNMFLRLDLIKFNKVVGKVQKHRKEILTLMEVLGKLDAYISIASFQEILPFWCGVELEETRNGCIQTEHVYHPLLSEPVANSIDEKRPVLLTGSNASGKSTFLKTIAINAVLAQTCGMALAKSYRSVFFRVYSSMALKDNLQGSESYFIVEIKSLKRIMDVAANRESAPVLCFVDEVLRGTNTVERIAASSRILQNLAQSGVMCFAATHDIELTHMLEALYSNYHFTEDVRDNDVYFNYRLYQGRATTRNAIKLLGILGYEETVIQQAENTAKNFLEHGVWEL